MGYTSEKTFLLLFRRRRTRGVVVFVNYGRATVLYCLKANRKVESLKYLPFLFHRKVYRSIRAHPCAGGRKKTTVQKVTSQVARRCSASVVASHFSRAKNHRLQNYSSVVYQYEVLLALEYERTCTA